MKKLFFLLLIFFSAAGGIAAQETIIPATQGRHKMAIFTPLYLDAAFNTDGTYRYSAKTFPKTSIAGLEFYHGASLAIDSLNAMNIPLDVYIYDSKSARESLEQQFSKCAADGVELIIANCSISELATLARLAKDKKITLLNATVPNDANTTDNPYFVVVNSTLQTQVEGVYHFIKNQYPNQPVVVFTKKGSSENYIRSAFEAMNKADKSAAIPVKFVDLGDSAAAQKINNAFDKTRPALSIIGSLDTYFAANILKHLGALSKSLTHPITVIGMPTLENTSFNKAEYKGVEIIYGTPFYNAMLDAASRNIIDYYNKKMYARPSDLVFRAFGLTYKFGRLLHQYGKNLNQNLASKEYRMFIDYDFQPVYGNGKLNYYENKKLYYLKYLNGSLQNVF